MLTACFMENRPADKGPVILKEKLQVVSPIPQVF